jgi:hypothetical protein
MDVMGFFYKLPLALFCIFALFGSLKWAVLSFAVAAVLVVLTRLVMLIVFDA